MEGEISSRGRRVGVIDVGSNTLRLLVAERRADGIERVCDAKAYVGLGSEIVRGGRIGPEKLTETAREARHFVVIAQELGVAAIELLVTAPGRQAANGHELLATLSRATGVFARVLTGEEEGRLAFVGAAASLPSPGAAAVCDAGGGSTEITVGDRVQGPFWSSSVNVGSLQLTASMLTDDPATSTQIAAAKAFVASQLEPVPLPAVRTAIVVGGGARALVRLVGRRLDEEALERALAEVASQPAAELSRSRGLDPARAGTLAGAAVVLSGLARRLGVPLHVGEGGLREGAAVRLLAERAAA